MERQREALDDKNAVVIMDNFKGQVTDAVHELLESNRIDVCLLPPNTTDLLQPMDIAVNKPVKSFLRGKFDEWYAQEITKQLHGTAVQSVELQAINLSLTVLKELGAKWLEEMSEYISNNPQFIVNGFARAGIMQALDGRGGNEDEEDNADEAESEESDTEESEDEELQ